MASLAWPVMSHGGIGTPTLECLPHGKLMGATVHAVETGTKTAKDAVDAAFGAWMADLEMPFYVLGSAVGPHPYPTIV